MQNEIIDTTTAEARRFQTSFFQSLDSDRNLMQAAGDVKAVWNGQPIGGREALVAMLKSWPTTTHNVSGMDVHPLASDGGLFMLVVAMGSVHMGPDPAKSQYAFHATFQVQQTPQGPSATSFSYRLVHKPQQTAVVF